VYGGRTDLLRYELGLFIGERRGASYANRLSPTTANPTRFILKSSILDRRATLLSDFPGALEATPPEAELSLVRVVRSIMAKEVFVHAVEVPKTNDRTCSRVVHWKEIEDYLLSSRSPLRVDRLSDSLQER
jgi:hypothetical protein